MARLQARVGRGWSAAANNIPFWNLGGWLSLLLSATRWPAPSLLGGLSQQPVLRPGRVSHRRARAGAPDRRPGPEAAGTRASPPTVPTAMGADDHGPNRYGGGRGA